VVRERKSRQEKRKWGGRKQENHIFGVEEDVTLNRKGKREKKTGVKLVKCFAKTKEKGREKNEWNEGKAVQWSTAQKTHHSSASKGGEGIQLDKSSGRAKGKKKKKKGLGGEQEKKPPKAKKEIPSDAKEKKKVPKQSGREHVFGL